MPRTLIFSDSHIGDLRFLGYELLKDLLLTEPYDRLILAGDIVDLLACRKRAAAALQETIECMIVHIDQLNERIKNWKHIRNIKSK